MNRVDYSDPSVVKNVMYNFCHLVDLAEKRDEVAMTICADIKRALLRENNVLTFKQRRYLSLWWQGFSFVDIAAMYHKNPVSVKLTVDRAVEKISDFLTGKI